MKIFNGIRERLKLYRLYASGLMAFIPCLGALSVGSWDNILLFKLFIVGLLGHGAGYILNEIVDIPIDSKSTYLREKPLIKGTVSIKESKAYVCIFGILGILITPLFFPKLLIILLFYLSFGLGISYALFSKKIPGMEIIYAAWAVVYTLAGALSTELKPTNLTLVLLLIIGIIMFFNVAVIGGLKDIIHDPKGGGRTSAWVLGVRARNGNIHLSPSYLIYFMSQLFIFLVIPVLAPWLILSSPNIFWLVGYYLILFLIEAGILWTLNRFIRVGPSNRKKTLSLIKNYVIMSYFLIPAIFMFIISLEIVLFITIFPLLWAFISNSIVYRRIIPII